MKQENNSIMRGASGALGKELIFRQRAGKTIISLPPAPRPDAPTEKQLAIRDRFREAVRYAKKVIADPALKAIYQAKAKPGSSAFNTAITERLQAFSTEMATGVATDKLSVVSEKRLKNSYLRLCFNQHSLLSLRQLETGCRNITPHWRADTNVQQSLNSS